MIIDLQYYQSEECRQRVADTARMLLETRPSAFSLETIAIETALPKSVIRFHFPEIGTLRDQILEEFFDEYFPRVFSQTVARLSKAKHVISEIDLITMFLDTLRVMVQEKEGLFRADMGNKASQDLRDMQWSFFLNALNKYLVIVDDLIDTGRNSGMFDDNLSGG